MLKSKIKTLQNNTIAIALIVVFLFFSIITGGRLFQPQNLSNLILQNSYVLVMGCGMLLCILTGGNIDLSVGSTLCLSGAVAAQLLAADQPLIIAILVPLVVAAVIGVIQGYLIGYIHIPPFICTLAGMFVIRGIARIVLDSKTVAISNDDYIDFFTSYISIPGIDTPTAHYSALIAGFIVAGIIIFWMSYNRRKKIATNVQKESLPSFIIKLLAILAVLIGYCYVLSQYKGISVMFIWILAVVLLCYFITSKTSFGRYLYAIGGNEKAVKLSGINTKKVYFRAYLIMSILAAFAGLLLSARIGSVDGNMGSSYEMEAIAACFIGGASAYGGSGEIKGVVIGAILLGVINQGMSIFGLPDQWQYIVRGSVLLISVAVDVIFNHKKGNQ